MTTATPLVHAADLVQSELPAYLGPGFIVSHVTFDAFDHEDEVLTHIHVFFKPGHPKLEPATVAKFDMDMESRFMDLGLSSPPAISYGVCEQAGP